LFPLAGLLQFLMLGVALMGGRGFAMGVLMTGLGIGMLAMPAMIALVGLFGFLIWRDRSRRGTGFGSPDGGAPVRSYAGPARTGFGQRGR